MAGMSKSSAPSKSKRPKARPDDLMENYNLERAMRGTDAKATKEDLKAGRMEKKAGGGMIGYKKGGCVMAGRGGKYKGSM
jgi:hypothetical protein